MAFIQNLFRPRRVPAPPRSQNALSEILRQRRVRSVVWFHTDHWEPWGNGINEAAAGRVRRFTEQAAGSRFASKMTLFYLNGPDYQLKGPAQPNSVSIDGDVMEFCHRSEQQDRTAMEVVGAVGAETKAEFQIHIHHEQFTFNDSEEGSVHREIKRHTSPELDERRMRLLIQLSLDTIRRDTALPLERWAFIHGNWALNGSDRMVCHIDDELSLLMEYGCWGDFTFPAGRPHCDPTIVEHPYTCLPRNGAKSYDQLDCAPIPIVSGGHAIQPDRFFIWNSKAKHTVCSLDYYDEDNAKRITHREHLVSAWLSGCPIIDDVLYVKTHAHSMDERYYRNGNTIPLCHPDIVGMFGLLQRACDNAKIELRPRSVNEVLGQLEKVDRQGKSPASQAWSLSSVSGNLTHPEPNGAAGTDVPALETSAINDLMVAVAAAWTKDHPEYDRSVGEYYHTKIEQRALLSETDIAIADYCERVLPKTVKFFELGSGLGELGLMLALKGFSVVAFEHEDGRYQASTAIVSRFAARQSSPLPLALIYDSYPEALKQEMLVFGKNALIATNLTSSHIMEHFDEVVASFAEFDHIIMDVTRFGTVRDDPPAQDELIRRIIALGFSEMLTVARGSGPDIRHFSRYRADRVILAAAKTWSSVRYSDIGEPIPPQLQRAPMHIFRGSSVSLTSIFPRLRHMPKSWQMPEAIALSSFPTPVTNQDPLDLPTIEIGTLDAARFVFPHPGAYNVHCNLGTFKCLTLDPALGGDAELLEVARFVAGNIAHSNVDENTIVPWKSRENYLRPDLLLKKLFTSDQPLGLPCDNASDVCAYILWLLNHAARRIWLYDRDTKNGHVVIEAFFPTTRRWAMLDCDYGVVVRDRRTGQILSTEEIVAAARTPERLAVEPLVTKKWLNEQHDVTEAYVGQVGWSPAITRDGITSDADLYLDVIARYFRARQVYDYAFRDGFDDVLIDRD